LTISLKSSSRENLRLFFNLNYQIGIFWIIRNKSPYLISGIVSFINHHLNFANKLTQNQRKIIMDDYVLLKNDQKGFSEFKA